MNSMSVYYPTFFNLPQPAMAECYVLALAAAGAVPSYQGFQHIAFCFVAENIAMGITNTDKGPLIATALQPVMVYGQYGALWEATDALSAVVITPQMAPYLTQARVNWLKNQMQEIIASL
jgi:hypothetical protein